MDLGPDIREALDDGQLPASWDSEYLALRIAQLQEWNQTPPAGTYSGISAARGAHRCQHCTREHIEMQFLYKTQRRDVRDTWFQKSGQSVGSAIAAAASGCPFFVWVVDQIVKSRTPIEQLLRTSITFKLESSSREGNSDVSQVTVLLDSSHYSWPIGTFTVLSDYNNDSAEDAVSRLVDGDVSSRQSLNQVRRWPEICLESPDHERCRKGASHIHPPRFLDVGLKTRDIVKLCHLDPTRLDNYLALSYCWGEDQTVKTKLASLVSHQDGIRIENLPKTIQDAIHVTRELNIDFLWVDSLCIIQDSAEDLAKEVADMSHYYSNAVATLCAAIPGNCMEGFLGQRHDEPEYQLGPFYFPASWNPEFDDVSQGRSLKLVKMNQTPPQAIDKRAWTLQEALLSTRLIYFGARQIKWSCRSASYGALDTSALRDQIEKLRKRPLHYKNMNDYSYNGHDASRGSSQSSEPLLSVSSGPSEYNFDSGPSTQLTTHSRPLHPTNSISLSDFNIYQSIINWYDVVNVYTSRDMSFYRDRVPAISGIAREFSSLIPPPSNREMPKYLAGIWNFRLPLQLLWTTVDEFARRPLSYRAPSWSWACLECAVEANIWKDEHIQAMDNEVEILDCKVDRQLSDAPYGAVTGGSITLEGKMISTHYHREMSPLQANEGIKLSFDTLEDRHHKPSAINNHMDVWCLQIVSLKVGRLKKRWGNMGPPVGLILVENEDGTFRRVGVFYTPTQIGRIYTPLFKDAEKQSITIV